MFSINTLWSEIALVTLIFLIGNIFLGHFDPHLPPWRKFLKYLVALVVVLCISIFFGQLFALVAMGLTLIPVIVLHGYLLPKKGINGWTGEPREKYEELRGWRKTQ
jgi:uncharacterized protein involved in cysteine biosynthesis